MQFQAGIDAGNAEVDGGGLVARGDATRFPPGDKDLLRSWFDREMKGAVFQLYRMTRVFNEH